MRRLSEIKGDEAFDVLADLLDPVTEIAADEEIRALIVSGKRLKTVSAILKNHKRQIVEVLAILEGVDPEIYKPSLAEIPIKLIYLVNDPVFAPFFTSQGQNLEETFFGSAMENTEATEKE